MDCGLGGVVADKSDLTSVVRGRVLRSHAHTHHYGKQSLSVAILIRCSVYRTRSRAEPERSSHVLVQYRCIMIIQIARQMYTIYTAAALPPSLILQDVCEHRCFAPLPRLHCPGLHGTRRHSRQRTEKDMRGETMSPACVGINVSVCWSVVWNVGGLRLEGPKACYGCGSLGS